MCRASRRTCATASLHHCRRPRRRTIRIAEARADEREVLHRHRAVDGVHADPAGAASATSAVGVARRVRTGEVAVACGAALRTDAAAVRGGAAARAIHAERAVAAGTTGVAATATAAVDGEARDVELHARCLDGDRAPRAATTAATQRR